MRDTRRILTSFFIVANLSFAYCCHTFKNTDAEIKPRNEPAYTAKITGGCIERVTDVFNDKQIEEITVRDQNIPQIHKDSIRHLSKLKSIRFENCQIQALHPQMFRNLPRISEIVFTGNSIPDIRSETFNRDMPVQVLILSGNDIEHVENFKNMYKLRYLDLKNNEISTIDSSWFVNTTNLQEINMSNNKLSKIPANCFEHTKKLVQIDLSFNNIAEIPEAAFAPLNNIEVLNLRYNKICRIDPNAFPRNGMINHFDLGANALNFLSMQLLDNIKLKSLTLTGNPMKCSCMDPVLKWLDKIGGLLQPNKDCTDPRLPHCVFPKILSIDCVEEVDKDSTKRYLDRLKGETQILNAKCARVE